MLKTLLPISVMVLALAGPAVAAESANYCAPDTDTDDPCLQIKIQNTSSALVKTVIVTQKKSGDVCTYDARKFKDNLDRNDKYWVYMTPICTYKIRFKPSLRAAATAPLT